MEALDQARQAMEGSLNNQSNETSHSASSSNPPEGNQGENRTQEEILLDKLDKFKFGDKEWTPDQLRKSIMLHSDYTKKTQQLAEARKYYDNLDADIEAVKANPQLAAKFKEIYPEEFHRYLKYAGHSESQSQQQGVQSSQQQAAVDPQFLDRFSRLESYVKEKEVQAYEAQLDNTFATLSKKYPNGVEDVVLAKAQALLDKGEELSNQSWENLWKQSHESMTKRIDQMQQQKFEAQKGANSKAKGPGIGGGIPGEAPRRMTLKEATEQAVSDLSR